MESTTGRIAAFNVEDCLRGRRLPFIRYWCLMPVEILASGEYLSVTEDTCMTSLQWYVHCLGSYHMVWTHPRGTARYSTEGNDDTEDWWSANWGSASDGVCFVEIRTAEIGAVYTTCLRRGNHQGIILWPTLLSREQY